MFVIPAESGNPGAPPEFRAFRLGARFRGYDETGARQVNVRDACRNRPDNLPDAIKRDHSRSMLIHVAPPFILYQPARTKTLRSVMPAILPVPAFAGMTGSGNDGERE